MQSLQWNVTNSLSVTNFLEVLENTTGPRVFAPPVRGSLHHRSAGLCTTGPRVFAPPVRGSLHHRSAGLCTTGPRVFAPPVRGSLHHRSAGLGQDAPSSPPATRLNGSGPPLNPVGQGMCLYRCCERDGTLVVVHARCWCRSQRERSLHARGARRANSFQTDLRVPPSYLQESTEQTLSSYVARVTNAGSGGPQNQTCHRE